MTKPKYPQSDALELARINAIRLLGLHENNTAQDRAKAMGYDLEAFHGTDAPDIESLDPERTKIIKGVFSSTNPMVASTYAKGAAEKGRAGSKSAPNIIPLLLKSASHTKPHPAVSFNKNLIDSFKASGHKGVYRPESEVAVTFDPSQMRSRFAAFDPARAHEAGLSYANGGNVQPTTTDIDAMKLALMNKAKLLEGSHTPMFLYHGTDASEGGKGKEAIRRLKQSKEGALGSGAYLTPNPDFGSEYANRPGGNVLPLHARITNPLILTGETHRDPMVEALVKLGMTPDKASDMVEKAYEQKGYIGKQVQQRAQAAGHDALMQYRDGKLSEVVHYNPRMIKSAIGNRGTYDTSIDDLSMADGGSAHMAGGGSTYPTIQEMIQHLQSAGRTPIVPAPNRWFHDPAKHPFQQKMIERVLAQTGQGREGFPSGSYINPQTGEPMDFDIMHDLGVAIDPATGRPMMSGIKSDLTEIDPKYGSITKSNLVRKGLFKHEGGDDLLKTLAFLATIEKSGKGHHYGLSTQYASPAELVNTMTGQNPTLRPHSRGDIFGMGDEVGRISIQGKHHPVYEKLLVAPAGSDVQGRKLHKAKGGTIKDHITITERPL